MKEETIQKAFSYLTGTGGLRAEQIRFIITIISHFKNNSVLEHRQLAQQLITDINDIGIYG